jgi:D-alanine-D-alanine ligase
MNMVSIPSMNVLLSPLSSMTVTRTESSTIDVEYPGLFSYFRKNSVDMVFNIAEGTCGKFRESEVPAVLDYLNIPYTGSDPLTLSLTLDKAMAKRIVMSQDIPTPRFKKVERMEDLDDLDLRYPLFIKLCYEGSSKGVRLDSKISDFQPCGRRRGGC